MDRVIGHDWRATVHIFCTPWNNFPLNWCGCFFFYSLQKIYSLQKKISEAFNNVYWFRILLGHRNFFLHILGAFFFLIFRHTQIWNYFVNRQNFKFTSTKCRRKTSFDACKMARGIILNEITLRDRLK